MPAKLAPDHDAPALFSFHNGARGAGTGAFAAHYALTPVDFVGIGSRFLMDGAFNAGGHASSAAGAGLIHNARAQRSDDADIDDLRPRTCVRAVRNADAEFIFLEGL